ncbi:hypothetical protein TBR22_A35040 [Luteitalea sp. TBR-22]|nr:hypothetical protein TBR22_A35040 [Luteitalea sp. TBR-22]
MRSAPQKQPIANCAKALPAGNGPSSGAGNTWCRDGTGIGVSRPGNASAAVGTCSDFLVNHIGWSSPVRMVFDNRQSAVATDRRPRPTATAPVPGARCPVPGARCPVPGL